MTTKTSKGKITGLLALTMEQQEACEIGDFVHVVGDYEVEKADGTKPCVGVISVAAKGRENSILGTSVGNDIVPGQVTVEARGLMVRTVEAGAPINAGVLVGIDANGAVVPVGSAGAPTNEVQTLTEGGSGLTSFTVTFDGDTTGSLDDDVSAADLQTALEGLDSIGEGNVVVTGGPLASGPFTVTFVGALAGTNVPAMTTTPTGGTGTVDVATATAGAATVLAQIGIALMGADAEGDEIDVLVG